MAKVFCKWCGHESPSVSSLVCGGCNKNPDGKKHELYEGSEKPKYTCKYCGKDSTRMKNLTCNSCKNSPSKHCVPAM